MPKSYAVLAATISWVALLIAAAITIFLPLGYWLLSLQSQSGELRAETHIAAGLAGDLIHANPDTWHLEKQRLRTLLTQDLSTGDAPEVRSISDRRGRVIVKIGNRITPPTISRSFLLLNAGQAVGRIRIKRSLSPLLPKTGLVALVAAALGLAFFTILRVLPLRLLSRALHALHQEKEKAEVALASIADGVVTLDQSGQVDYLNPVAEQLTGWGRSEARGRPLPEVLRMSSAHSGRPLPQPLMDLSAAGGNALESDAVLFGREGQSFAVETTAAPMRDEAGRTMGGVLVLRDVTERKQAQQRLSFLANYDSLTGLPNRSLFRDRLSQAMAHAQRNERLVALMFLDLDRFKTINDSLGHVLGDHLLREVAARLKQAVRAGDSVHHMDPSAAMGREPSGIIISRLGGDEFTVILEDVEYIDAVAGVAQRILDALTRPFELEGRMIYASTSIGVTIFPFDDTDLDGLVKNADAAMYRAKEVGRNNYQFHTKDMNAKAQRRLALETELRRALEREQFLLHYQPQIDLASGKMTGVEALLRWPHPERGMIPPAEFIPVLEDAGLMMPVCEWVLHTTCAQLRQWRHAGLESFPVAINLSARQFMQKDLAGKIGRILQEYDLEPHLLELEITETLLMEYTQTSVATLAELHAMGIRVALDDFGTGYSSLSYLKRFTLHKLKIDQSFVRDIDRDPDAAAIVKAVIVLAHSLRLEVVAEGVESEQQLRFLRRHNCGQAQGYLFSRAVTATALETWLKATTVPPREPGRTVTAARARRTTKRYPRPQ